VNMQGEAVKVEVEEPQLMDRAIGIGNSWASRAKAPGRGHAVECERLELALRLVSSSRDLGVDRPASQPARSPDGTTFKCDRVPT
jgi:hypothetical protein